MVIFPILALILGSHFDWECIALPFETRLEVDGPELPVGPHNFLLFVRCLRGMSQVFVIYSTGLS